MNEMMLIVDDNQMNREILRVLFHRKYEILEAENGEEALAMADACRGSIDIVLLDLMMEGLSGFDVLERRKELDYFREIPVVVITSSDQSEDQIRAFELGANDYITIPFMPEIVQSRVNNASRSSKRIRAVELELEKMRAKSEIDEMTGILNKATAEYNMDRMLRTGEQSLSVMLVIDVDNFKTVNDTLGHQEGDHVLKTVAIVISDLFRKNDIVGRIGGDEFCVLMVDLPDLEIARSKVNELIQTMRYKPHLSIPEYVTLSIGMASNDQKNTSYAKLFEKADQALYDAKQAGKARYREYGAVPIEIMDDRPIVLLLSESRGISSTVHALIPTQLRVVEVSNPEKLGELSMEDREKVWLMYADVSERREDADEFWNQIRQLDWMDQGRIFAICEEGNLAQYMAALTCGIADMFTAPIDHEAFRRRTIRKLEELGMQEQQAEVGGQ